MYKKVDFKLIAATGIAVLFTWLIHEFSHWLMGQFLGYEMAMSLNSSYPLSGEYSQDWHYLVISAIGPFVTIIQAIVIYGIMRRTKQIYAYPFLFTCFYMRLLAGFMNLLNLNDEGRIGAAFGIGVYTLPLIVSGILFFLVYHISNRENYSLKLNLAVLFLVMFFSSILILADQFLRIRLL